VRLAELGRCLAAGPGLPNPTVTRPARVLRWSCWAGGECLQSATDDERRRLCSTPSAAVSPLYASARASLHNHGFKPTVARSVAMADFGVHVAKADIQRHWRKILPRGKVDCTKPLLMDSNAMIRSHFGPKKLIGLMPALLDAQHRAAAKCRRFNVARVHGSWRR
jgi:hypothetical protein